MPDVLVTGGTGRLGRQLVSRLLVSGRAVRVLSRRGGRPVPPGAKRFEGDLAAKTGLREAAASVEAIVHCASGWPHAIDATDIEGTKALIEAAQAGGSPQLVYVSILGIDQSPLPYYQAKRQAEVLIEQSNLPWSILRAAQFHDLVLEILHTAGADTLAEVPVPAGMWFQSIDVSDVADALAAVVQQGSSRRTSEVAGPQVLSIEAMAEAYLRIRGRDARVRPTPTPGDLYDAFRTGKNLRPDRAVGTVSWENFLQARYGLEAGGSRRPQRPDATPSRNTALESKEPDEAQNELRRRRL